MKKNQLVGQSEQVFRRGEATLPNCARTLPQSFRQVAQRRLRGFVPLHFEKFYRAHLRFVPGCRLKALEVAALYASWAASTEAPSMGLREMKRAMGNIGHLSINSNGKRYCDVGLAADYPHVSENYPDVIARSEEHASAIADRLDAMITELSSIRAQVTGAQASTR